MTVEAHPSPADVVYTDAEVLAGGGAFPAAEAIWIRAGRVAAVGQTDDVLRQAGAGVPRQRLGGATVVPGLIDTHPHLLHFAAFMASSVNILAAKDHDDIVGAIRRAAARTPAGQWIFTTPVGEPHYFHRRSWRDLKEGTLPDRGVLDRATADHPTMILAWAPITPNVCAVNSAALSALGIDAGTPDRIDNVWIEKDEDGRPTGILRGDVNCYYNEDPFFRRLLAAMPPLIKPDVVLGGVREAMASYNARGITTIYESHAMEMEHIGAYQALRQEKLLTLRVRAALELQSSALPTDHPKDAEQIRSTLEAALAMRTRTDDWLRIDGITASVWGPCYGGYLYWREGYRDAWGGTTTGRRMVCEDTTRTAFDFCAEHGLPLNLSSMSPDEHDEHLALTAEMMAKHRLDRTGWLVEHGCMLRDDQIRRYADLGFDMTVSMSFTFGKGDMYAERIGPHALAYLNPLRRIVDAGLAVAASMDWGPTNPWEQMQLAVTHEMWPSRRRNDGPAQVVTRAEAFDMWTAGGAKVLGWEGIGALAPGCHADVAILDRNPITCAIDALPATRVLRTIVGGHVVHDDGSL